jgi:predicted Zn finger-like uncharacterized protein
VQIACNACQSVFRLDSRLVKSNGSLVRCTKCQTVFRVYPPDSTERRKSTRIKTRNLIAHLSVDENGELISQGLGKALDISKGGILLETPFAIKDGQLSLMAVDKDSVLFEIKGELAYCKRTASGMYHAGIKFIGTELQVVNYVSRLIKEYNHRKKLLYFAVPQ